MIDLAGKSAVVTGGSRGIGRAVALRLAAQGASIAFSYRGNAAAAEETRAAVEACGVGAVAVQGDVTDPTSAEGLISAALDAFGKVDILVNNAGITRDDLIMRMNVDAWREVLEPNLFGAFYTTKAVMRPMLRARAGRIVNVSSVSGQAGNAGQANYSAAKAGVVGLTKTMAKEWGALKINVNAVAFGFIETRLTQAKEKGEQIEAAGGEKVALGIPEQMRAMASAIIPLGRPATPEEAAGPVLFLCSEHANYVHGQVLNVTGGQFGGMYI